MGSIIDIEKELIPYHFEISLVDELFEMEIHYNSEYDFFTVDLLKNKEVLVYGEKIVYGMPLFRTGADERFPKIEIIPYDESEKDQIVTWQTLHETVFLFIEEEA
ncbi:hypothetical protein JNUCC42_13190 [Brevibacterium sp. JNUCC-42]|nr:hypothetical protein JNUCC42_13190 [Brevibacterium sp. JNUCC-42]